MKKIVHTYLIVAFAGLFLAGCASGPTYSTISSTLPSLSSEMGRVYFYRSSSPFGAAVQPSILMNGEKVGDSVPGGVFFKDVSPGNYEVATSTEVERKLTFTMAAGQTRYVETSIGVGFMVGRVHPTLVEPKDGAAAIQELSFVGKQ